MKKLVIAFLMVLAMCLPSKAFIRNIQDNHRVVYNIIDTSGDHVTGETVTLQIQRLSDGYWFDFNDSSFKNTGWTNKTTNLTEDSTNGLYYYIYNPPAGETGAEQYLFLIDNASATYGDHQSTIVSYQDFPSASDIQTEMEENGASTLDSISDLLPGSTIAAATDIPSVAAIQAELEENGASLLDTISDKLPTNYIMGSSDQTDKDDDIDEILTDTGTTLPGTLTTIAGYIDTEVAAILQDTETDGVIVQEMKASALADFFNTDSGTTYGSAVSGSVVAEIADNAGGSSLTESGIADAIWDELLSGHAIAGSTGEALSNAGSGASAASIADAVWDEAMSGHTSDGTFGGDFLDADIWTPTKAGYLDEAISGIDDNPWDDGTRTLTAGTNIALAKGVGITGFNDLSTSDIDTRLAAIGLDHLLGASVSGTDVTDNSIFAKLVSKSATADWDDFVNTTDSLQALRDQGDSAWITAVGFSTHSAASVWSVGTRSLTELDEDNTTIDLDGSTVGDLTTKTGFSLSAASIDSIWDEVQSGHSTAGTFGYYLDSQVSAAGGGGLTEAGIADAIWDELLSGHAIAGSAGKKLDDLPTSGTGDWTTAEKANILGALSVEDSSVDTDLDDIELKIRRFR